MVVRRHLESKRDDERAVPHAARSWLKSQRGVFAPMSAAFLMLIFTLCAMALGLSQMYNRKIELQAVADAVALAAARELDGTEEGVTRALQKAATTATRFHYNYRQPIVWSNDAIKFGNSPTGPFAALGADGAANLFYASVDTASLGGTAGTVAPAFVQFVSAASTVEIAATAVAGRIGVKVVPLAVCALDNQPAKNRSSELVEYGFRRGVPYDLMNLNPGGTTKENFVIDPIVPPGAGVVAGHNTSLAVVGPFVCTGKMWMPRVTGGAIHVTRPFPIDPLYQELNSRFDLYPNQRCSPNGAPPDLNVQSFTGSWMSPVQENTFAAPSGETNKLRTIADPDILPAAATAAKWGALWSYSKAVKYGSYQAGKSESQEPKAGYAEFPTTDFDKLYQPGLATSGYPKALAGGSPYRAWVTFPPTNKVLAEENRRVLNVPLLECPVAAGANVTARVLAVGKFFMTEPATTSRLVAEFAGIAPEQSLVDQVELFK